MSIGPVIIIAGLLPEEFDIEGVYRMIFSVLQTKLLSFTVAGFKNRYSKYQCLYSTRVK